MANRWKKIREELALELCDRFPIEMGWTGLDVLVPVVEELSHSGCHCFLRWDPERISNRHTACLSRGKLGDQGLRCDGPTMEDALASVLLEYYRLK